ncbi:glycoside hydrolase family 27 protein [Pelagicoccus mobilis]|uniref:Glycoside hydrolase family 27 protein n=1 Tax=Pelagicoccus mobilis TaxID=415221 RepID=A0A934RZ88_9BACT|nr:glycoside hydrolase family 27 protein [Pelagicoccus mobilis]MBK1879341.1 glycoside hydrolase family 27 protein [Pelagicoccus mobilis]
MSQFHPIPPSGWNSFDSFGGYLHEEAAFAQLEAFEKKLVPHGYDTFVVDIGWYAEYEFKEGTILPSPKQKHAGDVHLDEYGLPLPSKCYFPNGLQGLIDATHEKGLKFGIHMMRGVPRKAVELKLPIKGSNATAADIANTDSTCPWCHYNYGIDMSKAGAQEYYDSVVAMLADWGVDFIKYDDITGYADEIDAVSVAIERSGRPITLSLSHGGEAVSEFTASYRRADLVRITKDIWDDKESIRRSFNAWAYWSQFAEPGFWIDLDMIPFGDLQTMSPEPQNGDLPEGYNPELCGKGWQRVCGLSLAHRRTFMTQRALACSPLFFGGDMTTLTDEDLELLTHPSMLACNRNAICGKNIYMAGDAQVWKSESRIVRGAGWLGVFNRNPEKGRTERITLTHTGLGLSPRTRLHDVWNDVSLGTLRDAPQLEIEPDGCYFIEFEGSVD